MKHVRILDGIICVCIIAITLTGCRNNLVDNWDTYSGDTDVYFNSSDSGSSLTQSEDELAQYSIPEYWKDELKTAVEETQNSIDSSKGDYTSFFWYNDAHWSYGSQRSLSLLKYLEDHTAVSRTNFGGDVVNTYNIEHAENINMLNEWRAASLTLSNHHSVVGNHDDDVNELSDGNTLYSFLIACELRENDARSGFCYYIDDENQKTRYVYLSTGLEKTTADDLRFIIQSLNGTPDNWHVVFVSHIWFEYIDASKPTVGDIPEFVTPILTIIDAYNAREKGEVTASDSIAFDFSEAKAKVEFCIGGHTHVDFDIRTSGGVPIILTETDSYHLRHDESDTSTVNEASVNVVIADYEQDVVKIIRVGRGDSRTVSLTEE